MHLPRSTPKTPRHKLIVSSCLAATLAGGYDAHASNPSSPSNPFQLIAQKNGYLGHVKSPSDVIRLPPGKVLDLQLLGLHHGWRHLPPLNGLSKPGDLAVEQLLGQLLQPQTYADFLGGRSITVQRLGSGKPESHECGVVYLAGRGLEQREGTFPVMHEVTDYSACEISAMHDEGTILLLLKDQHRTIDHRSPLTADAPIPTLLRDNEDRWRNTETHEERTLVLEINEAGDLALEGVVKNHGEGTIQPFMELDSAIHLRAEELGWALDAYAEEHPDAPSPRFHHVREVVLAACDGDEGMAAQVMGRESDMRRAEEGLGDSDFNTIFVAVARALKE